MIIIEMQNKTKKKKRHTHIYIIPASMGSESVCNTIDGVHEHMWCDTCFVLKCSLFVVRRCDKSKWTMRGTTINTQRVRGVCFPQLRLLPVGHDRNVTLSIILIHTITKKTGQNSDVLYPCNEVRRHMVSTFSWLFPQLWVEQHLDAARLLKDK